MKLLVTKQECSRYLSVSLYRKEEEFNRYIREAQMFDLKKLVCEEFFQDIVSDNPERDYVLLLSGGSYEFEGKKYEFEGLKAVISYFAYARYIFTGHQVDTPMGIKEKANQDGEGISQAERRDVRTMYLQQADVLWQDCARYIERNKTQFPEWDACKEGCGERPPKSGSFKMQLI